ncbi:MAG: hypothetical protein LBE97_01530 [Holosporales bacterium]|jgi:uncharacterized heparinase superfamily protein|nr:hypothetical protein [Holosporales bacterium]
MLNNFMKSYYAFYVAFIQSSIFYKLSLDKRGGIFAPSKFITDPWPGDINNGKIILNGNILNDSSTMQLELIDFLIYKPICIEFHECAKYANSFFWIRDLQAIGGNSCRRYARKLISFFIDSYRKEKRFWKRDCQWTSVVLGERLCNWVFSYSFVAAGASDEFQKKFLSSLCEQYSHLLKSYKAETNLCSKIIALKGLIFCQCVMRNINIGVLNKFIMKLNQLVEENFDKYGMIITRNPVDEFNLFRSLIEIRFIIKNLNMDIIENFFSDKLSRMASCIRFLRLGDGCLSSFQGDSNSSTSFIIPTRQIIDAAISVVNAKLTNEQKLVSGFDRLSTKKIAVIVNTSISEVKSKFNHYSEPGINIFDFESSFGISRVIYRSDISILSNGYRIKVHPNSQNFSKKDITESGIFFKGESVSQTSNFFLAIRRELFINANIAQLSGSDFVSIQGKFLTIVRLVLNEKCSISKVNEKTIMITIEQKQYKLTVLVGHNIREIIIRTEFNYPSVEFELENGKSDNVQIKWSLEQVEN